MPLQTAPQLDPPSEGGRDRLLGWAAGHNAGVWAGLLVKLGASPDRLDQEQLSPLHRAAANGHASSLRSMLRPGVNLDPENPQGETPLHVAVIENQRECVRLLLGAGANIGALTAYGWSPLHVAARHGRLQIIGDLLDEWHEPVDTPDENGRTALHLAARFGYPETALLLLEAGAQATLADGAGMTPLHFAAESGVDATVSLLIERGASVAARDNAGRTPEMAALSKRHLELGRRLQVLREQSVLDASVTRANRAGRGRL